jgi:aryl-alcohol dehydrogenase-like predicted oxidoreductase
MDRRNALQFLASVGALAAMPRLASAQDAAIVRAIPSTGEKLPVIGLGTWITFDVGDDAPARRARGEILRAFFASGGRLVDSSPMYGRSEEVIGATLPPDAKSLFAATKVWTVGGLAGRRQMETSRELWRVQRFDLLQVHNFLDWETHLATLKAMKADGRVRYIGVTTSHGRRHDLAEKIMRQEKIDFVQFTYNVNDRDAEPLFPIAAERGIAVIINRPFDGGNVFGAKTRRPLPGWGAELGCSSWAEALLKFVVSQPAVTCAIPATSQLAHLKENNRALAGPLPDATLRRRIAADFGRA